MKKFINQANPFDYITIKQDGSFVVVGDSDLTDDQILDLSEGIEVEGWAAE